jgi:tetratricopeptide (TPR) repeat protein
MKTLSLALSLAAISTAGAQVYTPPSPQQGNSRPPTDTTTTVPSNQGSTKSPFGEEIPMLDPAAETVTVGGVTIPLGDNRIIKARFEKYLSQPEENSEASKVYRETIRDILAAVSPYREGGPDLKDGWSLLPRASTYPGDANICSSLAEAVYVAMLAKRDVNGLKRLNQGLEKEKHQTIRDGDWKTRHDRGDTVGETKKDGKTTTTTKAAQIGHGEKSLEYAEYLRRIAEIEILKKANIARTEVQVLQTKVQYQVNMIQWFVQRRFEHVLMASRFYNQIWKDGDTTLHIDKNSDVSKLFSQSVGVDPTVASLDSLANEAIREADKAIEAFNYLVDLGDLHSASQRLMEAFALGEYLEPVATLPRERKRLVQEYVRDLNDLYGMMQARDYAKARPMVAKLRARAKDFPSAKADSAIAGYTLASDLSIEQAKAHLIGGESDKAASEIKSAAEIWPTNPKLDEFRKLINNSSVVVTNRNDFDRLLSEMNYREIYKRQYEFAPVIKDDPVRFDAFTQIMGNLKRIEIALNKASEFANLGNSFEAYEQLAELREEFPDDPKLGRELEKLAPTVALFTEALIRARQLEDRVPQQTGSSMSFYLKARGIYPRSKLAEEGIQRLLDEILPESNGLAPTAEVYE